MTNATHSAWRELEDELAAWTQAGLRASLWWRDDDAIEPTVALDRLLHLATSSGWPLALAVIPARATRGLAERLARAEGEIAVLQHGFAHRNFANPEHKKIELGGRGRSAIAEELARGAAMMAALFGPCDPTRHPAHLAVLVPPWNRIADGLIEDLPHLGFRGLSAEGCGAEAQPTPGLVQVNTHVDVMRWAQPRGFLGEAESISGLLRELRRRRLGESERQEPIGLLTHHLAHDEPAWRFLERLLPWLSRQPAIARLGAVRLFTEPAA